MSDKALWIKYPDGVMLQLDETSDLATIVQSPDTAPALRFRLLKSYRDGLQQKDTTGSHQPAATVDCQLQQSVERPESEEKLSLLMIPEELLTCILHFLPEGDRHPVAAVCRSLRHLINKDKLSCNLPSKLLGDESCLYQTRQLRRLNISATRDQKELCLVKLFKQSQLPELAYLTLNYFNFEFSDQLISAFSFLPKLELLEFKYCSLLSVDALEKILEQIPLIRCCSVDVDFRSDTDKQKFASLANRLAGKVNLALSSLSAITEYLQYNWEYYRVQFPSGQIPTELHVPN